MSPKKRPRGSDRNANASPPPKPVTPAPHVDHAPKPSGHCKDSGDGPPSRYDQATRVWSVLAAVLALVAAIAGPVVSCVQHRAAGRAWVVVDKVGAVRFDDDMIHASIYLANTGNSPAVDVVTLAWLSWSDIPPTAMTEDPPREGGAYVAYHVVPNGRERQQNAKFKAENAKHILRACIEDKLWLYIHGTITYDDGVDVGGVTNFYWYWDATEFEPKPGTQPAVFGPCRIGNRAN